MRWIRACCQACLSSVSGTHTVERKDTQYKLSSHHHNVCAHRHEKQTKPRKAKGKEGMRKERGKERNRKGKEGESRKQVLTLANFFPLILFI